ncbi:DUF4349 domain-containing protein [Hymenobacter terrenus]|uniref:DUF4349 domain-containing protein n=1 Tax=Hymenobacter terrenus TaxID=1629124 RepID=UPI000619E8BB|nr:DUF4349 domain-containing protein [Hymenobacter terrenus]
MKHLIYPVLLGLGLAGCSQAHKEQAIDSAAEAVTSPAPARQPVEHSTPGTRSGRDIIYEGELDLAVDDFEQATAGIDRLLEEHHAYLGTAHETRANGQHRQEMTIKVKPEKFLPLVAALGKLGRIENKDVSSADVTADMLAAAASLSSKQTSEAKYQQLLAHTSNPTEIRRLEEQVRQSRLEAATAQTQLQQFGARSAWATLTIRYFQLLPTPAPSAPMPDFTPRFLEAFYRGWSFLLGLVVVLTNVWPLLLLGGVGAWGVQRWRLRHQGQAGA